MSTLKIEQTALFGAVTTPQKEIKTPAKPKAYTPPDTTLKAGLDEEYLARESVYLLRTIAGQNIRNLSNKTAQEKFRTAFLTEMALKQGKRDVSTLLRGALIQNASQKPS